MAKETVKNLPPVQRTGRGLQDALFDEIDAMRSGTTNPTRANAIAKLASGIMEVEAVKQKAIALRRQGPLSETDDVLQLGHPDEPK